MATDLNQLLAENMPANEFRPYCYRSDDADALTVYFSGEAEYSKRLTDHVTLYLSLETDEPVGCRIKGISGLIEDLPNYININHGGCNISVLFLPFWNSDPAVRKAMKKLASKASESSLTLDECGV